MKKIFYFLLLFVTPFLLWAQENEAPPPLP